MKEQLSSLYEYGDWVTQRLLDIAAALTEEQFSQKVMPGFGSVHLTLVHLLSAMIQWTNMRGQPYVLPRWQIISHCANHSTHHRSEIAAMLTELGHEPDSTDLLEYYLEHAGQTWKPSDHS